MLRHQPRLLEVEKGADAGQQHHEHGDADQKRGAGHLGGALEGVAAERHMAAFLLRPRPGRQGIAVAPTVQPYPGAGARRQQQGRQHQQAHMAHRRHQQRPQAGPGEPAQAGAAGDHAEQALGLGGGEHVGEHAPGQGNRHQVEHRQPDIKTARRPGVFRPAQENRGEQQQVGDEKGVGPGHDAPPRHSRGQPAKQRQHRQRRHEGAGEQPLQVVHAAGHAHGFAYRAQHEITGEQQEEHQQTGQHRRRFPAVQIEQAGEGAHAATGPSRSVPGFVPR